MERRERDFIVEDSRRNARAKEGGENQNASLAESEWRLRLVDRNRAGITAEPAERCARRNPPGVSDRRGCGRRRGRRRGARGIRTAWRLWRERWRPGRCWRGRRCGRVRRRRGRAWFRLHARSFARKRKMRVSGARLVCEISPNFASLMAAAARVKSNAGARVERSLSTT